MKGASRSTVQHGDRIAHQRGATRIRTGFVITSSDFGGTETFLYQLLSRIDRDRFQPRVLSLRPTGRVAAQILDQGIQVDSLDMSDTPAFREMMAGARALRGWFAVNKVEIVHSFLYRANVLSVMARKLTRRNHPVVICGQRSLQPMINNPATTVAARLAWRYCNRIVAVSEAVRDALVRRDRVDPAKIQVIPNGVDTTRFSQAKNRRMPARDKLGLGSSDIVVGTVGRLSPKKGLRELLEAFRAARISDSRLRLIITGEGPERENLESIATREGLSRSVSFTGFLEDPRDIYAALDVYVLPSLEEGSPNALLEAMSAGCATIASAVGGVPEIINHGESGLLVPPGSASAITTALTALAGNNDLRLALGISASQSTKERFDIDQAVSKHEKLYSSFFAFEGSHFQL